VELRADSAKARSLLAAYAEGFTRDQDYPIHVRPLLRKLHISFHKRVSLDTRAHGETQKISEGHYRIVIFRGSGDKRHLSPRERFTVAHELGHVLLDRHLAYTPSSRREYWTIESWCNAFAAALLVPRRAIQDLIKEPAAESALRQASELASSCRVSMVVAARRVSDVHRRLSFFGARVVSDAKGQTVARVEWSTSNARRLGIAEGQYRGATDTFGKMVLRTVGMLSSEQVTRVEHGEHRCAALARNRERATVCVELARPAGNEPGGDGG